MPEPRQDRAVVLESGDYEQTRQRLIADPIIQDMAEDIRPSAARRQLTHAGGGPTSDFMLTALRVYKDRGGEVGSHIGGPAEAILRLLDSPPPGYHSYSVVQAGVQLGSITERNGSYRAYDQTGALIAADLPDQATAQRAVAAAYIPPPPEPRR